MVDNWVEWALPQFIQVTLLIGCVLLVNRIWKHKWPHLMQTLWILVLLKAITPPVMSSPGGVFCWLRAEPQVASTRFDAKLPKTKPNHSHSIPGPDSSAKPPAASLQKSSKSNVDSFLAEDDSAAALSQAVRPRVEVSLSEGTLIKRKKTEFVSKQKKLSWPPISRILFGVWLVGACCYGLISINRAFQFLRIARQSRMPLKEEWLRTFDQLKNQLGNSDRTQLFVSSREIGPVATGFIFPRVIVPYSLISNSDPNTIRTILAHELIHLRRGDLWLCCLQTIVQSVWWFHPLVHNAIRQLIHCSEKTCDERVLAEIKCQPAAYARALLRVLEQRDTSLPVNSFPGIRAIDLTTSRLERIMSLGHGCRRHTPWWCWLIVLAVGIIVLPGGAVTSASVNAQRQETRASNQQTRLPEKVSEPLEKPLQYGQLLPRAEAKEWQLQEESQDSLTWDVSDLAETLPNQRPEPQEEYLEVYELTGLIESTVARDEGYNEPEVELHITTLVRNLLDPTNSSGTELAVNWISENRLMVNATADVHRRFKSELEGLRKYGLGQLVFTIRFITTTEEKMSEISKGWPLLLPIVDDSEKVVMGEGIQASIGDKHTFGKIGARSYTEASYALRQNVFSEDEMGWLREMIREETQTNVMMAPRVTTLNGQIASIADLSQRPFVYGVEPVHGEDGEFAWQPLIRVVHDGVTNQVRGITQEDGTILVTANVHLTNVKRVQISKFSAKIEGREVSLQVPEVEHIDATTSLPVPQGGSLVISGLRRSIEKRVERRSGLWKRVSVGIENEPLLVVITAERLFPSRELSAENGTTTRK